MKDNKNFDGDEKIHADNDAPAENENKAPESDNSIDENKKYTAEKLSAGRAVHNVITAIFAVIFLILLNILFSARLGFSSDMTEKRISSARAEKLLSLETPDGISTAEFICSWLDEEFLQRSKAEPDDIKDFAERSDMVEEFAEIAEDYAAYIVENDTDSDPSLTDSDILDFISENENAVNLTLDYTMTIRDYKDISWTLDEKNLNEKLSIDNISLKNGFKLKNLRFFLSIITILVVFALVLLMLIRIAIVLDKSAVRVLKTYGGTAISAGIITFVPALVMTVGVLILSAVTDSILTYLFARLALPFALIALCTGAFQAAVGIILRKSGKHIEKIKEKK